MVRVAALPVPLRTPCPRQPLPQGPGTSALSGVTRSPPSERGLQKCRHPSQAGAVPLPTRELCLSTARPASVVFPGAGSRRDEPLPPQPHVLPLSSSNWPEAKAGWTRSHSLIWNQGLHHKSAIFTQNIKTPSDGVFSDVMHPFLYSCILRLYIVNIHVFISLPFLI